MRKKLRSLARLIVANPIYSIVVLVLVSVILRVVYLLLMHPPLTWYDSEAYDASAWNLAQGLGYGVYPNIPDSFREPGYPGLFLAPLYAVFGHSILVVQIVQIFLDSVVVVLLYDIGRRFLKSPLLGFIIAALHVIYLPAIIYSGEILTEEVFMFLLVLSIWLMLLVQKTKRWSVTIILGVVLGILTLTRFVVLFLPFSFILTTLIPRYRFWLSRAVIATVVSCIIILPWIVRNYTVYDQLVLGRVGGMETYWTGSYIPWDGNWNGYISPFTDFLDSINSDDYTVRDQMLIKDTIRMIYAEPLGVAWIWAKKPLKLYFIPEGVGHALEQGAFKNSLLNSLIFIYLLIMHLALLIGVALGVMYKPIRRQPIFWIMVVFFIYFTFMHLPVSVQARYVTPLMPGFSIIAVLGWYTLWKNKHTLKLK